MVTDITVIGSRLPAYRPYTNIQPFTVRDGATYLLVLEGLREWLNDQLVPHIDKEISELVESWEGNTSELITKVEQKITDALALVNTAVEGVNEDAAAAIAAKAAAEAARDLAEQFASDVEAFQDSAIAQIGGDLNSLTRQLFDGLYASLDSVDNLSSSVDTVSSSVDNLSNSVDNLSNSVDAVSNSVDAVSNSVDAVSNSVDAVSNSVDAVSNIVATIDGVNRKSRIEEDRGVKLFATPRVGGVSPRSTSSTQYWGVPGVQFHSAQTLAMTSAAVRYVPFEVREATTVTGMGFEVTSSPTVNANVAVGIYATDRHLQPVDLVASAVVPVASGFTGSKSAPISARLAPGVYLAATHVSESMTVRSLRGGMSFMVPGLGVAPAAGAFTFAVPFSALADTGRKWNGREAGVASEHMLMFTWGDASPRPRSRNFMLPSQELVKGVNLIVKPGTNWDGFWGNLWDWDGWMRPQIDRAKSAGANSIRICGDFQAVWTGMLTQTVFNSRWRQVIDYAASLGMYTFVNGGGASVGAVGSMTVADMRDALVSLGSEIDGDPYVPGFDIIAENYAWASANAATVVPSIRAACDRPLTFSLTAVSDSFTNNFGGTTAQATLRPWVDYYDYHVYWNYEPSNLDLFFDANSKPMMFGELGGALGMGVSAQSSRYASIRNLLEYVNPDGKHVAGGIAWAAADQSTSDDAQKWGLWDNDGKPREWVLDVFKRFPTGR